MSDRNLPSLCLLGSLPWEGLPIELAAAIAAERVVILGRLDDIALRTYLQHAEALVFPSIYEGFGIPPLEAMAAGTPVIAADIPAVREICDEACLYFPVNDEKGLALALHVVLNEQHLRKSIIAAGSSRTGKFSWDRSADGLANLLLDVGAADHSQLALK